MNERERDFERDYYRYRRRRIRQTVAASVVVVIVVTLAVLSYFGKVPSVALSPSPPNDIPDGAVFVNSGLKRAMLTRTKAITYDPPPASTPENALVGDSNVVTALLDSDLRDPITGSQFAASLVQLSASPIGRARLQLSVVVNPAQQPSVIGGTYRGTVEVFAGARVLRVPLILYLAPRDGVPAMVAFLLLVTGATIGLGVKWITESLTRLAAARWRLEDLRRTMGGDRNSLPLLAAARLEEIEDRIRRQDTDDHLDKAFAPLLSNVHNLRSFAAEIRTAEEAIGRQQSIASDFDINDQSIEGLDRNFIESIARAETTQIERLRALDWPWSDPPAVIERVQALADQCSTATLALEDAIESRGTSTTFEVLDRFRKGIFADAVSLYRRPQDPTSAPVPLKTKQKEDKSFRPGRLMGVQILTRFFEPSPGGLVPWMSERPRWFAGAASVFVVSLVGLQLQYLNADNFGGELGDWLGLLLWAAVIELSGVSVLDVLSRLGTGNVPRGGAPTPPGSPSRDGATA